MLVLYCLHIFQFDIPQLFFTFLPVNKTYNHMYQEKWNIFIILEMFLHTIRWPKNIKKIRCISFFQPWNPETLWASLPFTGCVGRSWISAATREPRRNVGSKTLVVFLFCRNFRPGNQTYLAAKTVLAARSLVFNVSSKILTNSRKKQVIEMLEWNTYSKWLYYHTWSIASALKELQGFVKCNVNVRGPE